jgi:hypothetical protein
MVSFSSKSYSPVYLLYRCFSNLSDYGANGTWSNLVNYFGIQFWSIWANNYCRRTKLPLICRRYSNVIFSCVCVAIWKRRFQADCSNSCWTVLSEFIDLQLYGAHHFVYFACHRSHRRWLSINDFRYQFEPGRFLTCICHGRIERVFVSCCNALQRDMFSSRGYGI